MAMDRSQAREEALYAGLADDAPHRRKRPPPGRPRSRRSPRRDMIIGGLTLAVGLSIMAGAVVQPQLSDLWPVASEPAAAPARRAAPARPQLPAPRMQPVLPASIPLASVRPEAPPPPEPAPTQAAPPEVAPPAPVPASAGRVRTANAPPAPRVAPLPETGGRLSLPPEMAAAAPAEPRPPSAPAAPARTAHTTASFDCAAADAGAAEQMVCGDPELAAADRRLAQAYGRAMRSGAVDPRDLDLDQHDWAALREDAARYSRKALASVYARRIDELNEIAADGPP